MKYECLANQIIILSFLSVVYCIGVPCQPIDIYVKLRLEIKFTQLYSQINELWSFMQRDVYQNLTGRGRLRAAYSETNPVGG